MEDTAVEVEDVLTLMRETIGNLAQENAILKARIKQIQTSDNSE